jgi:hypothetical protein
VRDPGIVEFRTLGWGFLIPWEKGTHAWDLEASNCGFSWPCQECRQGYCHCSCTCTAAVSLKGNTRHRRHVTCWTEVIVSEKGRDSNQYPFSILRRGD